MVEKRVLGGREIALTRRKTSRSILRIIVTPVVKERPSGDRPIGFPERTKNCVIAPFAPAEYLTYEIRNTFRPYEARRGRCPHRPASPCGCCPPDFAAEYFDYLAGLSNTHLHRVFCRFGIYFCTNQAPGMIQEGGLNPLLGRFKGIPKGEIEIPLWYSFFRPSTALSFSYEKESGVETFPARCACGFLRPSCAVPLCLRHR